MVRVVIIGFPRTATTWMYVKLFHILKQRSRIVYGFFEPFNLEIVKQVVTMGKVYHDEEGEVPHTYGEDIDILIRLSINDVWFIEWVAVPPCEKYSKPLHPFLGRCWESLLSKMLSYDPVVLKDVVLWVKLPDLVEQYRDVKFVVPLREYRYVEESFLKWFREGTKSRFRKFLETKSLRAIFRESELERKCRVPWLLGVGVFYRYFFGFNNLPKKEKVSESESCEMLRRVYGVYCDFVEAVRDKPNVYVVEFSERLTEDRFRPVIEWVLRSE